MTIDLANLLTANEMAVLLRCNRVTIDRMGADGRLPKPIRVGNRPRWDRLEVTACIERQQS